MDKNAFGNLVLENEAQLYRIAKAILRRDEDCADAAQEAITRAFENLHTLKEEKYAKTWLIRILINECCRLEKRRQQEQPMPEKWDVPVPEKESYSHLYQALQKLDAEFRVTLVLHYLEGFQIQEVSEMLKISPGTVKSRLHRAKKKLQILLAKEEA